MNRIIQPPSIEPGNPLLPFDVFGHIHSGSLSLKIALIESVELLEDGDIRVTMGSGTEFYFRGDDAKKFLADVSHVVTTILQQMQQPQILAVPPGTQLRTH